MAAVRALLDSAPRVADLAISVEDAFGGDSRWFERCGPLETPVLQTMMALNLESLSLGSRRRNMGWIITPDSFLEPPQPLLCTLGP